jgi:hypothetical protein
MILLTNINGIIKNGLDLDIRQEIILPILIPGFEYLINPETGNLNGLPNAAHPFIQILNALIDLVFLADFQRLFDGEE